MEPLADRLRAILAQPEETWADAFAALAEEMPELLQDSDALAELMEEEMARTIANSSAQHCPKCGAFLNGDGTCSNPDCPGQSGGKSSGTGTGYTPEQRKKINGKGDWSSLGLPALRDIPPDPAPARTDIAEARKRLLAGESVIDPTGEMKHFNADSLKHIGEKGRNPAELAKRLAMLDAAEETVRNPHEIWSDKNEDSGAKKYIRITEYGNGRLGVFTVEQRGQVISWHVNSVKYDYYREGTLLYLR